MREEWCVNRIIPSWTDTFRVNYIENYILLVIKAYQSIGNGSHILIKKEEERRTELVEAMRNKKGEFNITFPIGYEVGEKTKRMDICCYLDGLKENNYICFECKRFLKTTITKSHFNKEYYGEGISRFENNEYSSCMPEAGMISFLETGNMDKLKKLMEMKLPEKAMDKRYEDCSLRYSFCYVYRTMHRRKGNNHSLSIYHILLDFT